MKNCLSCRKDMNMNSKLKKPNDLLKCLNYIAMSELYKTMLCYSLKSKKSTGNLKISKEEILDEISGNTGLLFEASLHLNKKFLTEIYFSLIHLYMNYENVAWARTTLTKLKKLSLNKKMLHV